MSSETNPNAELSTVIRKLDSLEQEIKFDYRIGVIVGVVIAVAQVWGACYIASKQEGLKAELASKLEANSELGRAIAQKKIEFYNQSVTLLDSIDNAFQEACYFDSYHQAEKELPELLEKYRKLLAQPTVDLNSNQAATELVIKTLRKYPDFVVEKWALICSPTVKTSDDEKAKIYKKSQELLKEARQNLTTLIRVY